MSEKWISVRRIGLALGMGLVGLSLGSHAENLPGMVGGLIIGFLILPVKKD